VKEPLSVFQFIILLFLVISGCQSGNKSLEFLKYQVIDPHPNTGKECCTDILMLGDINGDGAVDVVIGGEKAEGAGLVRYQFPSWEKHPIARGEFTTDGQLADVDGDGDLDIVIGTYPEGRGAILWFENVSGGKGEWIRHSIGKGYAHDVAVGDLNADGKMDVVACDKKQVVLWEQVSLDSWREHIVAGRAGEGIALSDVDGDGDPDIVYGGSWLENPGALKMTPWESHSIAPKWSPDTRVFVADMNRDGRPDVVLTVSEGKGGVSWFESPIDPRTGIWGEHPIEKGTLEGAHSLQVADFDGDGEPDILTAEMHTSRKRRVLVYLNRKGAFEPHVLARTGSHNMRVADIDGDGDIDIVGKNYAGPGRVIEMWENRTSDATKWKYISIDGTRPKSEKGTMGLCFTDADRDGFTDVVAGSFLYLNPGGDLQGIWKRTQIVDGMDVYYSIDVNGNNRCDLIGIMGDTVYWIEATDEKATSWKAHPVGKVAKGRTQGSFKAKLIPGEKPQLVFTRGQNLYVLLIPVDPARSPWPLLRVSTENEEEGLAVGDIDGDGDLDIAAVQSDGHHVVWLENPGSVSVKWKVHVVGGQVTGSQTWLDRIALADLNGDGRLDIIATEERPDQKLDAQLYWFEAPADAKAGKWTRHTIARHRSLNSMDIADIDGDGLIDIVVAEHTDQERDGARDNLTVVYLNRDRGRFWASQVVERGPHSSHLGARLVDLDGDGELEIVSFGWEQFKDVHLWKKLTVGRDRKSN
jgi:FG-GAP-like repeat